MTEEKLPEASVVLRVLIGPRTHGAFRPDCEYDQRTIYVGYPTQSFVALNRQFAEPVYNAMSDEKCLELYDLARLLLSNHHRTLEIALAWPRYKSPVGEELQSLFTEFLSRGKVRDSYLAAANRRRTRFQCKRKPWTEVDREDARCDYLRLLFNAAELLRTGTMTLNMMKSPISNEWFGASRGDIRDTEVLALGEDLLRDVHKAYDESCLPPEADLRPIVEFFTRVANAA